MQSRVAAPQLMKGIQIVKDKMKTLSTSQGNAIFVVGDTGSGKSAFITSMLGGMIKFVRKGTKYLIEHVNNQNKDYPEIGNAPISCTEIPSVYFKDGIAYYDPAGFLDTKGVKQQILNAYCNAKMFQRGCKARIILMVEFASLQSARGGGLVDAAKRLYQLFSKDFQKIIYSCVLVVSKVSLGQQLTEQNIIEQVRDITQSNSNLGPQCKMLLKTILQQKKILIYPTPPKLDNGVIEKIKRQINKVTTFTITQDACISVSHQAMNEIQNLADSVSQEINVVAKDLVRFVQKQFIKDYPGAKQLQANLLNLKQARGILSNGQIANGNLSSLKQLNEKLHFNKVFIAKLQQLFSHVQFCQTIHKKLRAVNKSQDILLMAVKECEAALSSQLQSITTRQQMKAITEKHMNEMTKQNQRFQEEQIIRKEQLEERQKKLRKQLKKQKKQFEEKMQQIDKKHIIQMDNLGEQLAYVPRYNQNQCQIEKEEEKQKGWCDFM